MDKRFMIIVLISITCIGCEDKTENSSAAVPMIESKRAPGNDVRLKGTWVWHNKQGFKLIEVGDSSDVYFTDFFDTGKPTGDTSQNRYFYFKQRAVIQVRTTGEKQNSREYVVLITNGHRFVYHIKGDTLIESGQMSQERKFLRVQNHKKDEEVK